MLKVREAMRRKLFFLIDRLQITRGERIAVSFLFLLLIISGSISAFIEPKTHVDEEYYNQIEEVFRERSRIIEEERQTILARYNPEPETAPAQIMAAAIADTIPPDTIRTMDVPDHEKININTAGADELVKLPGIGPAYAQRIVEWREENGRFTTVEQLLQIRGIGERRLEQIRPYIRLN